MTVEVSGPGAKLMAAREKLGFSRSQIAGELRVSYQRLADIEHDRKPISLESILRISVILKCDPHSIDSRLASNAAPKRR
jgi:transcriptional regulator with XRE-family HTH domain